MHYSYLIVTAPNAAALTEVVNEHIKLGWQAQGGVAIAMYPGGVAGTLFQALVAPSSKKAEA